MREPFSQRLGKRIAAMVGWEIVMEQPPPAKCVIIGAHHTSTWDLPLALMYIASVNLPLRWVMKDTVFWGPLGWLWRSLGGIPVNRRTHEHFVARMAELIRSSESFMLIIAPEGTRGYARYWKTGFYYIAQTAGVPIVLGFIDFKRKALGMGPLLVPTGNIEADFEIIRKFYSTVTGKYPDRHSEIRINTPQVTQAGDVSDG